MKSIDLNEKYGKELLDLINLENKLKEVIKNHAK
jgi:hypothetical protein